MPARTCGVTVPRVSSRWSEDRSIPRGEAYQERFAELADRGVDVHGEASLVEELLAEPGASAPPSVLDAGCGTGRVAIELHRRGMVVQGVDLDPAMLAVARRQAPGLDWHQADLATFKLADRFDAVVLAGNVLVFVQPGCEAAVLSSCAALLGPGGLLIAGFQVTPSGYGPHELDRDAGAAGLELVERWATWDRAPWREHAGYQVSVHRFA